VRHTVGTYILHLTSTYFISPLLEKQHGTYTVGKGGGVGNCPSINPFLIQPTYNKYDLADFELNYLLKFLSKNLKIWLLVVWCILYCI
jgi:hypothetical protein